MWTYTQTNELYHYGVKGMKWGVRRSREVRAVNKQYKKELGALKKDLKKGNKDIRRKYEWSKPWMGETYSSVKYYKGKKQNKLDYKSKKEELQKKYEPDFKKAQKQAESRIASEKVSNVKTSKKSSVGKKVAVGLLAGYGAYTVASLAKLNKKMKAETGVGIAAWMSAARKLGIK